MSISSRIVNKPDSPDGQRESAAALQPEETGHRFSLQDIVTLVQDKVDVKSNKEIKEGEGGGKKRNPP